MGIYFHGYFTGYNARQQEYLESLVESSRLIRKNSQRISDLVKREKELLYQIKEKNLDCKEVLNFNLRSCFAKRMQK